MCQVDLYVCVGGTLNGVCVLDPDYSRASIPEGCRGCGRSEWFRAQDTFGEAFESVLCCVKSLDVRHPPSFTWSEGPEVAATAS